MKGLVELLNLLHEDFVTHRRDLLAPGFAAVASHRFGKWVHSLPRGLYRKPLVAAYRAGFVFVRNVYGIELPYSVNLGRRVRIEHQGGIVIHGSTYIGDDCVIRQGVTLGNRYDSAPDSAPVVLRGVSIGVGASILGEVIVGTQARIGAHALVLENVPPRATVVGPKSVCRVALNAAGKGVS